MKIHIVHSPLMTRALKCTDGSKKMGQDVIKIERLLVYAHHGVYAEETMLGQKFFLNMELYGNTRKAGRSDDLSLSTNYGEVCLFADRFMRDNTCLLIEAAAEKLAEALLLSFPLIERLRLEVCKPEAPIPLPFASVSVQIVRGWKRAYVAFGSSMGERERYVQEALAALGGEKRIRLLKVSDILHTSPYGGQAKEEFLNGVCSIDTLMTPEELLSFLQEVEQQAGRMREVHWGDRTLDLDILLYEGTVMSEERLIVPHKDMANRDFVLVPLAQIAPYEEHPVLHKSIWQLKEELAEKETHIR